MTTFSRVIGEVTAPGWDSCGGHKKSSHKSSHRSSHKSSCRSKKHSWGC
jgi:hypothetical protein